MALNSKIKNLLPDASAAAALEFLQDKITATLGSNLVGLYLFGSLTYGAFVPGRSDLDLIAVLQKSASTTEVGRLRTLFVDYGRSHWDWFDWTECSFTPLHMMQRTLPPLEPRPWFGNSRFYEDAPYGNEWLINQYLLCQWGIPIFGPDYARLVKNTIKLSHVRRAALLDLESEWAELLNDGSSLQDPHIQSYVILNLCRILYTVTAGKVGSKQAAAAWVADHYSSWRELIQEAENWRHGMAMHRNRDTQAFLAFVVYEVGKKTWDEKKTQ
ncbi:MAG: aminoglycoside adenylyltransferase domain-containing protein [Pseudomonadota bacterium]